MQAKTYPFPDSDILGIFNDPIKANLIKLPEMKRSKEAARTIDPKYCKYHHLVKYPIHDCLIFKYKVIELTFERKITLEEDSANANLVTLNN